MHPRTLPRTPPALNMMRYHRVSPDCHPLPNGRRPNPRISKDDEDDDEHHHENGRILTFPAFDSKPLRARPPPPPNQSSAMQDHHFATTPPFLSSPESSSHHENHPPGDKPSSRHHEATGGGAACHSGGDVLLQWGHNKRSRGSRSESRGSGDDSSRRRRPAKIQRRSSTPATGSASKQATATAAMPPPSGGGATTHSRGTSLRSSSAPVRVPSSGVPLSRNVEERHHTRQEKRSPPSPPEKMQKAVAAGATNGSMHHPPSSEPEAHTAAEKVSLDLLEWPRIYTSLSRKEKEEDFLAMKGTKLPQRPKKRAKNVDKNIQYCFPGLWLTDLTKGRYEVREKKSVKKKRRGLKGMEIMESDSD